MPKLNTDTIRPGTAVTIGDGIQAVVTANVIRQDAAGKLYVSDLEVTWWADGERHCINVDPWEARPASEPRPKTIGF